MNFLEKQLVKYRRMLIMTTAFLLLLSSLHANSFPSAYLTISFLSAHNIGRITSFDYEIERQNVIIYEIRPAFMREGEFTKMPMAKLTYVSSRKIWKLYWKRASGKWEKYEPMDSAREISALVQEIEQDTHGCFFG